MQEDIVPGLNIYGSRVQTRSTKNANDLPVSGLREQIFEVGALLDDQGDTLCAMLQDVRYLLSVSVSVSVFECCLCDFV